MITIATAQDAFEQDLEDLATGADPILPFQLIDQRNQVVGQLDADGPRVGFLDAQQLTPATGRVSTLKLKEPLLLRPDRIGKTWVRTRNRNDGR